jgi:hypothetical protein
MLSGVSPDKRLVVAFPSFTLSPFHLLTYSGIHGFTLRPKSLRFCPETSSAEATKSSGLQSSILGILAA